MKSMFLSGGSHRRVGTQPPASRSLTHWSLSAMIAAASLFPSANAQVGFSASILGGLVSGPNNKASKVTSLQFGPDNRLYFIQVNGTIIACDVARLGPNNYVASNAETISLVKNIPNYDDDGNRNFSLTSRQATGILVVGTAENPVIYATSCDPREGAGSGAVDLNLDTNSAVLSRLTRNSSGVWEKVDVVRGLPRSEENHAVNGLNINADGTVIYLAVGGNTNAGGPSNNFAFACETALAAAILTVDLTAINALPVQTDAYGQNYLYNLPTLDDPNPARAHNLDGSDVNDPFGGNDGLNQAKLVAGGPVQVYASGFRNPYDVLIAKTPGKVGKMYTFDNAGNSGWGGYPKNNGLLDGGGASLATNEYVPGEPGVVNNKDGLHRITGAGYYGGHPHPLRANPTGAGWTRYDDVAGQLVFSPSPTTDWPPVSPSLADSQQGQFLLPGPISGALLINSASTCGMAEYTASNFGGAMVGDIITTLYSAATVQRVHMNADGTAVTGSSVLLNGSSWGTPLDVTCPGPGAAPALSGTIFVGHHSSKITVLEPSDFDSAGNVCSGIFSFSLDEDNDGYSNADEVSNASDPCSPAVTPSDWDGDFLSDLLDADDDNDGIPDTQDLFPIDALNGLDVAPPVRRELFNELGIGFFSIGFKGVMLNPGQNYAQRMAVDELIAGGTAGLFTDPLVGAGNPHGASNTQMNAFHLGVNLDESTGPFLVSSGLGGLLFNGAPTAGQSHGIFIGNGDQDNYVKVAVNANSGAGGIEVVHEENGVILTQTIQPAAGLFGGNVTLHFLVDPVAGTVHPGYSLGAGPVIYAGALPLTVGGKILDSIRGPSAMAFGLLATTGDVATPTFNATWDYFQVNPVPGTAAARLTVASPGGSLATSSTNSPGSFRLENQSTGGQRITSIKVDLATAMLPDIVFDPDHTAGDHDGTAFQADTLVGGTGKESIFHTFGSPLNGVDGNDGYQVLNVHCDVGVDFGPGDLLTFSSDIDPNSIKGVVGPGPFDAGSVSGLEMTGATITVTFDDGSVRKVRLAGYTSEPGTFNPNKTSVGVLSSSNLPVPGLSVQGQTSPFSIASQPSARIAGPPGSLVQVGVFHSALHLDDGTLAVPNGGYNLAPFDSNSVVAFDFNEAVIGANGFVDVPLELSHSEELGGINLVSAILYDTNGNRSSSSNILTIDYNPNAVPATALYRINVGGGTFEDAAGQIWSPDSGFTSGSSSTFTNEIAGTIDDAIYQSFRYDDSPSTPLDYVFPVTNGQYEVRLHFAETWSGITAAGQRVFDVLLEGQTAINDLDVFATAGPNTALVQTLQTTVNDGQLNIGLRHVAQNPFISGIEIFLLEASGPDEDAPTAPGVLTYTGLQAGSIQLAWSQSTDLVGVAGYRVFQGSNQIGTTTLLNLPVSGLIPSTPYVFGVEAYDAAGNVSGRTTLEVTTPADQQNPTTPGSLKGVAGNGLAVLSWTASTDDAGVAIYRIYRGGLLIQEVTGLGYTDSGLTNGTLYDYEVVAVDVVGKLSTPAAVSVRPRALGPAVLRVNCGGGDFTDVLARLWSADFGFNTGVAEVSTGAIAGTLDDALYQARRFDRPHGAELKYTFPLPDGEYELRLHFAEVWSGASSAGIRVFDVKVEDQVALEDFDIFAAGGFATAHVEAIPVTVTGGTITIEFIHGIQNPTIAGIEIYGLESGPPDLDPPPVPADLAVTGVTAGSVSLGWTASEAGATYDVRRDGNLVGSTQNTEFTDTGLIANTAYVYTVVARDAVDNASAPAGPVNATTAPDTIPPSSPGSLTAAAGNATVVLSWNASTDNGAVERYDIYRNGSVEPVATVTTPGYTDTGLTNGTLYTYVVVAVDSADNESDPASASATPMAVGNPLLRVNCGNLAANHTDPAGNIWTLDSGYNSNNVSIGSTTVTVAGTTTPEIYKTHRFKNRNSSTPLKYEFNVPNGNYDVRLHFAEVWTGATAPGARVFNVLVEGATALPNLDVFAEVGLNHALVKSVPATVADGKLTIDLTVVVQNPQICAIEVYPVLSGGAGDNVPPSMPGSLAAQNVTASSLDLVWTASTDPLSGVAGYRVYRRIPATESPEQAQLLATVPVPGYSDSGLNQGTAYEYRVIAVDGANNLSDAAILPVTTLVPDGLPPSIPPNLVATPGLTQMVLSWDPAEDEPGGTGVAGYHVYRDGEPLATVTTPGYTDTGLPSGTEFDYEVIAFDAALNAGSPAQVTASTDVDLVDPTEPGSLLATPGYTTMDLSWTASTDAGGVTGYRVYRGATLIGEPVGTTFQDSGLIPGTLYPYSVVAVDSAGRTSEPAETDGTTLADTAAPSVPAFLTAVAGDESVTLSWLPSGDNVGVTGYEIRRNGNPVPIATVAGPGYVDSGLENGTAYTYQVRAVDAALNASADASASATPRVLGTVLVRLNAGGNAFTDALDNAWSEDIGFNIGTTATSSNEISGTVDDILYQAERYDTSASGDDLEYAFAAANGTYEVKLHFAETYAQITAAGQRVFDVYAEESLAIDDLDIFARVGANAALTMVFPVTVTDGQVNLRFEHLDLQNPKVCGIEIHAIQPVGPPTFEEWLVLNNLTGQTNVDSDGGGLSNFDEFELQMDPNDTSDDLGFRLHCTTQAGNAVIALPVLKPIGNYHLHRDTDLTDISNVANRIDTVTKAEIEAMTPEERATYAVPDPAGGPRAFYQLIFEPVAN